MAALGGGSSAPTNLPAFAALAGSGVQAAGQAAQGSGNQLVDLYDQGSVDALAAQTATAGATRSAQLEQQTARQVGAQRAAAGASGVDPNQGSPLAVMSDTATQGELGRQLSDWQTTNQVNALLQQGQLDVFQGRQAQSAGTTAALSTLLSAGSIAAMALA